MEKATERPYCGVDGLSVADSPQNRVFPYADRVEVGVLLVSTLFVDVQCKFRVSRACHICVLIAFRLFRYSRFHTKRTNLVPKKRPRVSMPRPSVSRPLVPPVYG